MAEALIPPEEEDSHIKSGGEILIRGTYTAANGQEVPVEIHTNRHGLIYQRWRAELAARRGGGVRELKEGEVYEISEGGDNSLRRIPAAERLKEYPSSGNPDPKYFQKQPQPLDIPDPKQRTLLEVFAEEKAQELAQIQLRLEELRAQLRLSSEADAIRAEIAHLEKQLLGDP